jgi:hypothetical protein
MINEKNKSWHEKEMNDTEISIAFVMFGILYFLAGIWIGVAL